MGDNVLLQSTNASPWQFDSTKDIYYLEIAGTRIAQIDANGNLFIKGRVLKLK